MKKKKKKEQTTIGQINLTMMKVSTESCTQQHHLYDVNFTLKSSFDHCICDFYIIHVLARVFCLLFLFCISFLYFKSIRLSILKCFEIHACIFSFLLRFPGLGIFASLFFGLQTTTEIIEYMESLSTTSTSRSNTFGCKVKLHSSKSIT